MKIKKIISQYRRDFKAIFICENCNKEEEKSDYDDHNFHENVIPNLLCNNCGEKSPENYIPRTTKYPESFQI